MLLAFSFLFFLFFLFLSQYLHLLRQLLLQLSLLHLLLSLLPVLMPFFCLAHFPYGFSLEGGRGAAPACCQVLSIIRCMHSLLSLPPPSFCSPYTAPFPARSVFLKRAKFSFINALNLPHSTEGAASRPREGMEGASRQSYIMWVHSNEFRTSFEWAVLCLLTAAPCRERRLATLYLALLQVGNFFSTLAQTVVKLISHFTIRICFV